MGFDVVVVGGGHAGCEAAAAAARMGAEVGLVTLSRDAIGRMPCNPAVGGIGKGHLVVELDALGGLQGWAADRAGIQFRVLNRSRGPAVWGPRAQCDKERYSQIMRRVMEGLPGIAVVEGEVVGLLHDDCRVFGVRLASGWRIASRAVIVTAGTFLAGVLHTGPERAAGGRVGEGASLSLGQELRRLGLELRRFKTGTPPRVERTSVDLEAMTVQEGDAKPRPFSWRTRQVRNAAQCWTVRTPPVVQTIISENLHRSPLFSGSITGVGPRYCPSIEDKVVRFPSHQEHTVFVEPEGLRLPTLYLNGLSTSLPRDVQEQVVRAIPGLKHARFARYGYAVEYDVVAGAQVDRRLAARDLPGLYFAGQVLGTSGYEEAAVQGFLAGVNAILELQDREPLIPGRDEGYVGILVDDLVGRDHQEPYRMFTSRAEHRLVLGVDSARQRLMARGVRLGLVPEKVFHVEQERWRARERALGHLEQAHLNPDRATRARVQAVTGVELVSPTTWAGILRRHDVDAEAVAARLEELADLGEEDRVITIGLVRYAGYLERQRREAERVARLRGAPLPRELRPEAVPGLSREVVEALRRHCPRTLAEAERLPGLTPAAIAILAGCIAEKVADTAASEP